MFAPSRIVVVDDKPEHLKAIVSTFGTLGTPTLAIHYRPEHPLEAKSFRGVRCLVIDLQLQDNLAVSNFARHYATIQGILEDNIAPSGGPFIMILWTDAPERASELEHYLRKNLDLEKPQAFPLAVIPIAKQEYISIATGELEAAAALQDLILTHLKTVPPLAALVQWELDLLQGAGSALAEFANQTDDESRRTGTTAATLGTTINRLAIAAVGKDNVERDVESAVNLALAPILSDHMHNIPRSPARDTMWRAAIESNSPGDLTAEDIGRLNSRLHVADINPRPISGDEWGAICEMPASFMWGSLGTTREEYLRKCIGLKEKVLGYTEDSSLDDVKIRQVRIGAACDYAQHASGPVPYMLCAVVPALGPKVPSGSTAWFSPVLLLAGDLVRVVAHPRFAFVRSPARAQAQVPEWRLREAILMDLISRVGHHSARPGIVQF